MEADLPAELVEHIGLFLGPRDLYHYAQCSPRHKAALAVVFQAKLWVHDPSLKYGQREHFMAITVWWLGTTKHLKAYIEEFQPKIDRILVQRARCDHDFIERRLSNLLAPLAPRWEWLREILGFSTRAKWGRAWEWIFEELARWGDWDLILQGYREAKLIFGPAQEWLDLFIEIFLPWPLLQAWLSDENVAFELGGDSMVEIMSAPHYERIIYRDLVYYAAKYLPLEQLPGLLAILQRGDYYRIDRLKLAGILAVREGLSLTASVLTHRNTSIICGC